MRPTPFAGRATPAPSAAPGFAAPGPAWTVLCDFDGTISLDDVTDSLLLRFARPGWEALELEWRQGRIGSRECMGGQIALLDCSREELDAHLASLKIDRHFANFAATLRAAGLALHIVSDGLDLAIEALLARHGIEGTTVSASHLVSVGPRSWKLEFPHARPGCASATCKCAFAAQPGQATRRRVLVIGDGASDFCVAGGADLVLAQKSLLAHCAERQLPHRAVRDFADVLAAWDELTRRAAAPATDLDEEALHARG
jgi:2-hydroxy-3-keto-5-methylthiopentenyl-1-phosphate phosphatase